VLSEYPSIKLSTAAYDYCKMLRQEVKKVSSSSSSSDSSSEDEDDKAKKDDKKAGQEEGNLLDFRFIFCNNNQSWSWVCLVNFNQVVDFVLFLLLPHTR